MKRLSIARIVIDEKSMEGRDAHWLRQRIEQELGRLLSDPKALDGARQGRERVDGGTLPAAKGEGLPQAIAERVIGSLRGGE